MYYLFLIGFEIVVLWCIFRYVLFDQPERKLFEGSEWGLYEDAACTHSCQSNLVQFKGTEGPVPYVHELSRPGGKAA